jgi:hypothetical protein
MKTAAELLEETNEAISRCLTSQSHSIAGRNQQMAQLSQLQAMRASLLEEVQGSQNGGQMCSVGQIDPAS